MKLVLSYTPKTSTPELNLTFLWCSSQKKTLGIFSIQLCLPESRRITHPPLIPWLGGFESIVIPGVNFTPINGLVINGRNWAYNHGPYLEGRSYFTPQLLLGVFGAHQTQLPSFQCFRATLVAQWICICTWKRRGGWGLFFLDAACGKGGEGWGTKNISKTVEIYIYLFI